ncbi:hypothetical protein RHMOL_Rhmol02G0125800 [Rhododendron molle]|uniref:Uncharacterized protein n=1 Tax=Rhododendron molle TaxID=49168 RepID=A0ACC0PP67_RHOML|nr:hypothetical protein RHMOL_Rhmol02G0125800 [Rhododendron molle]
MPLTRNDSGDGGAPAGTRLLTRLHPSDKSAAGGDVILGGFATALVAAIFCYICVTRRNQETKTVEYIVVLFSGSIPISAQKN